MNSTSSLKRVNKGLKMYAIRKTLPNGSIGFKTFEGWVRVQKDIALDLSDVMRFTSGEAKATNLSKHEQFVWFGCYKGLER